MAQILLADDDRATRDLVRRALEADGHTVTVTQDGGEALEQVKEGGLKFDLLVSDVEMPMIDGVALAEGETGHRPGRVCADAGQLEQCGQAPGHLTAVTGGDGLGAGVQA